jgi:hypothetical protein
MLPNPTATPGHRLTHPFSSIRESSSSFFLFTSFSPFPPPYTPAFTPPPIFRHRTYAAAGRLLTVTTRKLSYEDYYLYHPAPTKPTYLNYYGKNRTFLLIEKGIWQSKTEIVSIALQVGGQIDIYKSPGSIGSSPNHKGFRFHFISRIKRS